MLAVLQNEAELLFMDARLTRQAVRWAVTPHARPAWRIADKGGTSRSGNTFCPAAPRGHAYHQQPGCRQGER